MDKQVWYIHSIIQQHKRLIDNMQKIPWMNFKAFLGETSQKHKTNTLLFHLYTLLEKKKKAKF